MPLIKLLTEGNDYNLSPQFIKLMGNNGYDIEQLDTENYLGEGASAVAYKINNDFVVKVVMKDLIRDIKPWKKIMKKDFKHIAKVFDIIEYQNYYFIIQEFLPFSTDVQYIIQDEHKLHQVKQNWGSDYFYSFNQLWKTTDQTKHKTIDYYLDKTIKLGVLDEDSCDDMKKMLRALWNGFEELNKYLVPSGFNDIHTENVRQTKNGTIKILDF